MNHPNREDLVDWLCGDPDPARRQEIDRHLESCPACRSLVESWQAVRQDLARWTLPEEQLTPSSAPAGAFFRLVPVWRWCGLGAAAAALVLAGFGLARLVSPAAGDSPALRQAITQHVRDELRSEFSRFAAEQAERQQGFQQALTRTIGQIEAQRVLDYAGLRRDMETLAVRAEDEFVNTRQDLIRLAAAEPPPGGGGMNR